MSKEKEISLVVPCYNESAELEQNTDKVVEHMRSLKKYSFEVLLVNDGSKDTTKEKIAELEKKYPSEVRALGYDENRGKGYAVRYGMERALGGKIIFMDADLSTDIKHIEEFALLLEDHPIVIGSRKIPGSSIVKKQTPFRVFIGKIARLVTQSIVGLNFYDTQCGFKAFTDKAYEDIGKELVIDRFCFDVEMLYIAKRKGYDVKETPVVWKNREDSTVNPIRDGIKFASDLIRIRKIHKGGRK